MSVVEQRQPNASVRAKEGSVTTDLFERREFAQFISEQANERIKCPRRSITSKNRRRVQSCGTKTASCKRRIGWFGGR